MSTLKPTLILFVMFTTLAPTHAQFMNKLKKSIGNTLEDQAVKSINKGLTKALTKAEDKMWENMFGVKKSSVDSMIIAKQEDPEAFEKMMESIYKTGEAVTVEEEYDFETRVIYKLTTENGKKSEEMDYAVLINPDAEYMATQMDATETSGKKSKDAAGITTIMDYGNNAVIMLTDEQKTAQILSLSFINSMAPTEDKNNNLTIEKSGKTKKILGYTCEEYLMNSDDAEGSVWISKETEFISNALFTNMEKSAFAQNSDWMDEKGMMMEMDMMIKEEKKKDQSHMKMTVVSMDKVSNNFVMADYQTMNFGGTANK